MGIGTIQKIVDWLYWLLGKIREMLAAGSLAYEKEKKEADQRVQQEYQDEKEQIEQEYQEKKPKEKENMVGWWRKWGGKK